MRHQWLVEFGTRWQYLSKAFKGLNSAPGTANISNLCSENFCNGFKNMPNRLCAPHFAKDCRLRRSSSTQVPFDEQFKQTPMSSIWVKWCVRNALADK